MANGDNKNPPSNHKIEEEKHTNPAEKAREELDKVVNLESKSTRVLYRVETVFPFKLFPKALVIDEVKILVIEYFGFGKHVFPIFIKDIKTVTFSKGLFFGAIRLEISGYEKNPDIIKKLPIDGALTASRIILGLIATTTQGIDLTPLNINEIREKLEKVGAETSALRS